MFKASVKLCFLLTRKTCFNNFELNFLSRDQLERLSLATMPLCLFGNLIFSIIARMFYGNHLKCLNSYFWPVALPI